MVQLLSVPLTHVHSFPTRRSSDESEERRVGKECMLTWRAISHHYARC